MIDDHQAACVCIVHILAARGVVNGAYQMATSQHEKVFCMMEFAGTGAFVTLHWIFVPQEKSWSPVNIEGDSGEDPSSVLANYMYHNLLYGVFYESVCPVSYITAAQLMQKVRLADKAKHVIFSSEMQNL
ncbi:hypothetical protein PR048_012486 [Dryococelus australis]|uniref:Uncharacterized protein n=1 Tax=Dryococelus australis TaxID=614101 RepID=A0ABQ9HPI5_9NEOP|nr:hypothetical protein PR048_012486 [Dryococelus australis]